MARLYADEDFPLPVVEELRRLGHDILTTPEAGRVQTPDPDQLAFATSDGRAIVTHNRTDFIRLHRLDPNHAGIVVCTRDNDAVALASRIDQATTVAGALAGQLIRVNRPNVP